MVTLHRLETHDQNEMIEKEEERRYLNIGDNFWKKLMQMMGCRLNKFDLITVVFGSESDVMKELKESDENILMLTIRLAHRLYMLDCLLKNYRMIF